jgi:acetyl-CoA C-acetyltransferase
VIRDTVIVAATRTPIGRAVKGGLADVRAEDLLTAAITGALDRLDGLDTTTIDDLIAGAWMQTRDQGGNVARRAAVLMGLDSVPGVSVNRACTSSLQAIRMAHHAIALGEADTIIAGGVESISHYEDPRAAGSTPMTDRHPEFADAGQHSRDAVATNPKWRNPRDKEQLPDLHLAMGHTAENVAALRGISRQEQDDFALRSQRLTAEAVSEGFFAREIVPIPTGSGLVDADESPRPDTTAQQRWF